MAGLTARDRIDALKTVQALATEVIDGLSPSEWVSPSAAAGWTVHDVVAHMSSALHDFFGPLLLKVATSKDIEGLNETSVEVRRRWSDADVAAEYRRWAPRARRALRLTQLPVMGSVPVPMAELGRFPARVLPSAIAFDTHTHLYHDIAPALSHPLPAPDASVMAATLEWMMLVAANVGDAAVPLAEGQGIGFSFTGAGASDWTLQRSGGRLCAQPWQGHPVVATITGAAADFPAWGTHRRPWRELGLDTAGDRNLASDVLDAIRVI